MSKDDRECVRTGLVDCSSLGVWEDTAVGFYALAWPSQLRLCW
jgi:hypothetical protein